MKPFLNELPLLKNLKRTRKEKKTGNESAAEPTHFTHTDKAPPIPPSKPRKSDLFLSIGTAPDSSVYFNNRSQKTLEHPSVS